MFADAGEIEPPAALRRRILRATAEREERTSGQETLTGAFGGFRPRRGYALAFAAGLAAGIVIISLVYRFIPIGPPGGLEQLRGTISAVEQTDLAKSEPVDFELPGITGGAILKYTEEQILAELDVASDREITVVLHYSEAVHFDGYQALEPCDHRIKITRAGVELTHTGACSYIITLGDSHRAQPPIDIQIYAEGGLLFEKTIHPQHH
jgi:hypothetical protein